MSVKLYLSNMQALRAKYKDSVSQIFVAINNLVKSDRSIDLDARIVYLDNNRLNLLGITPVADPANEKQNKDTIDAIYNYYKPNSMVLLGATDCIPHQLLDHVDDQNPNVPSDLPYACSAPYSKIITNFRMPNRIVTRLPDIAAIHSIPTQDASYFLRVLRNATNQKGSIDRKLFQQYFSISTKECQVGARLNLENIFGNSTKLYVCPPDGPEWTREQAGKLSHLICCHGRSEDPCFYGFDEENRSYPHAMCSEGMRTVISPGTIMASGCCYGAELYNPKGKDNAWPMVNTYLYYGAKAYLGASNIAYGGDIGVGWGDLLCQFFLKELLQGMTVGMAMLRARQQYVKTSKLILPSDQKTLGQFNCMGDATAVPVKISAHANMQDALTFSDTLWEECMRQAQDLENIPFSQEAPEVKPSESTMEYFNNFLATTEHEQSNIRSYVVVQPNVENAQATKDYVHALSVTLPRGDAPYERSINVEVREINGEIKEVKQSYSK